MQDRKLKKINKHVEDDDVGEPDLFDWKPSFG